MQKTATYIPQGVCSRKIEYTIEHGVVLDLQFTGGCNGNLSGISRLVVGMPVEQVVHLLAGTRCGAKSTSCPDQLARALARELTANES